jgi:predicted Rossmann fold flavoprotein
LQISSYWQAGEAVTINLLPEKNLSEIINDWREQQPQKSLKNLLSTLFPKRFIETLINDGTLVTNTAEKAINQLNHDEIDNLTGAIHAWQIKPNGTEGYRTAEVTLGGVDTDELSSKTFEAKKSKGLYFIGEVTDVTGWLGGYNFQWCWSSGWACGQAV